MNRGFMMKGSAFKVDSVETNKPAQSASSQGLSSKVSKKNADGMGGSFKAKMHSK